MKLDIPSFDEIQLVPSCEVSQTNWLLSGFQWKSSFDRRLRTDCNDKENFLKVEKKIITYYVHSQNSTNPWKLQWMSNNIFKHRILYYIIFHKSVSKFEIKYNMLTAIKRLYGIVIFYIYRYEDCTWNKGNTSDKFEWSKTKLSPRKPHKRQT